MSRVALSSGWLKTRRRTVGVAFLLIVALLVWLAIALYNKRFTPVAMVTLHTDSVGNEMHEHADVKVHGVKVGEVRDITADGASATLKLAIQPDKVHLIPANVTAMMLPTTLFGQRYVGLQLPAHPARARLDGGSVISQDRSADAIEVEQVFDDLLPTLRAVQPQKLAVTLTAVATALQGRGTELGNTLTEINSYLREMNPELPKLDHDIAELVNVMNGYDRAAPDLIDALREFTVTSKTIVNQRRELESLYDTMSSAAGDLEGFLRRNRNNIIRLSADSRSTLQLLGKYSSEIPCTLHALTEFKPNMDRVLGAGTGKPGLHVTVHVVPSLGPYVPGKDAPSYDAHGGPHCYPSGLPSNGASLDSKAAGTLPGGDGKRVGLGIANSPSENELVNELVAPEVDTPIDSLPDWSSVLVGPVYRGAEVTVK